MLREHTIREHLKNAEDNLTGWTEPGGWLLPTEPDPEERERVRQQLVGAIFAYKLVLGELTTVVTVTAPPSTSLCHGTIDPAGSHAACHKRGGCSYTPTSSEVKP